jgi:hypothetical protein
MGALKTTLKVIGSSEKSKKLKIGSHPQFSNENSRKNGSARKAGGGRLRRDTK